MSLKASKLKKFKYTDFKGSLSSEMAIYYMVPNL